MRMPLTLRTYDHEEALLIKFYEPQNRLFVFKDSKPLSIV